MTPTDSTVETVIRERQMQEHIEALQQRVEQAETALRGLEAVLRSPDVYFATLAHTQQGRREYFEVVLDERTGEGPIFYTEKENLTDAILDAYEWLIQRGEEGKKG